MDVERAWQQMAQRLQSVIHITRDAEKMLLTVPQGRRRLELNGSEDDSIALELVAAG